MVRKILEHENTVVSTVWLNIIFDVKFVLLPFPTLSLDIDLTSAVSIGVARNNTEDK